MIFRYILEFANLFIPIQILIQNSQPWRCRYVKAQTTIKYTYLCMLITAGSKGRTPERHRHPAPAPMYYTLAFRLGNGNRPYQCGWLFPTELEA